MKRDIKFDNIRFVAMLAIVLCHFFQVKGLGTLSQWLSVGVQVFFVLSAKLLSNKDFSKKADVVKFLKTRVTRIYIPVWIYLACLLPVLVVIGKAPTISGAILYILGLAGFSKSVVLGLGHFWYISVLIICYLLVPVMYKIAVFCERKSKIQSFLLQMIIPVSVILVFLFTDYKYYGVNIALFCGMYFFFYKNRNNSEWYKGKLKFLLPITILLVVIRLICDTEEMMSNPYYKEIFVTIVKCVVGLFLFFVLYNLLPDSQKEKNTLVTFGSKISYEIYISHQFIVLALYEFIPFFRKGFLGGVAMLVVYFIATTLNAVVLYYIKGFIEKKVFKR